MASVGIINVENKYDYPDNYELQQHRQSSVAVEWHKKCITTASSTVLLGPIHKNAHRIGLAPYLCYVHSLFYMTVIFLLHFHFHF